MSRNIQNLSLSFLVAASALVCHSVSRAADGIEIFTSGAHFFKRVVTNTNPQTTSTEKFEEVPGANTTIFVPPQSAVLVNVGFDAEGRCSGGGTGAAAANWCELSITIGGVEGSPQASTFGPDTYAYDSTNQGAETIGSWEAHAFSRHRCVRNETNSPLPVRVAVNWKVTNFAGTAPEFWLDDSALVVEMSRGCSVDTPVGSAGINATTGAAKRLGGAAPSPSQQ
ncbi:MAG: hypothetical protein EPO01_03400 [Aquabacterium sp.]|nr:MAG: hypothetical protein EPO01_03400 [Aquabacterium sp.]